MAKGWCPECDRLFGISPTGERIDPNPESTFRSVRWRVDMHKCRGPLRFVCEGSGAKI